jgi:pyruvate dehydrogenase E2 component (dihydrolipoamide acetyltransferase)
MADLVMPSLGADMDAGTLVEWRVVAGDTIARGQVVALIETQKATMEMESFVAGVIEQLLVEPGTKVAVGTPLARVRAPADAAPLAPPAIGAPVAAPIAPPPTVARPRRSSPAARKLARERGIDLAAVTASGPSGAVVLRDVVAYQPAPPPVPSPALPRSPRRTAPAVIGPVRDAIAAAMTRSKREIPHYYLAHTISLHRTVTWLTDENARRQAADRILIGAVLLQAVTRALWEIPELNGHFVDGTFRPAERVHLGIAVSLRTGGVIAPAILDADQKSVDQIMAELRDLVARARAGRLRTSELADQTITVTSLGERGCDAVWGVINPPQVAIVGFGAIADRPWADAGAVAVHPTVTTTLAADHRVSDGHRGGLFLAAIDHHLQEHPRS